MKKYHQCNYGESLNYKTKIHGFALNCLDYSKFKVKVKGGQSLRTEAAEIKLYGSQEKIGNLF